ncbi:related to Trafficking protein particle complex subunit 23 [Saccharomycodes ludwigii]|uniref:Trafficking protein particle complex subunit n=1 Tax=Saccharomycodes ludwigii TaxID=36035 RepID=A0A376BAG3_9ASCO|nr:hypothetical protein SCDLUD_001944 [Saccharomycodes ludwigii]KAH3902131.1 hypothetical protein SCDLUD_001944 [Saccharomycodes ludwigii]SSD61646.1 related to Trafficking protein particle complex subunit 23 [Saccharomycodes ludwigii]
MAGSIESLMIINKSGGLIYHKEFNNDANSKPRLSSNEMLVFAGTLHGAYTIASRLKPKAIQLKNDSSYNINANTAPRVPYVPGLGVNQCSGTTFKAPDFFSESFPSWNKTGIKQIETDDFTMYCYQTLTGVKFIMVTLPHSWVNGLQQPISVADNILRKVYCLYSDYVMKSPFYSLEMPIKNDIFDKKLKSFIASLQRDF